CPHAFRSSCRAERTWAGDNPTRPRNRQPVIKAVRESAADASSSFLQLFQCAQRKLGDVFGEALDGLRLVVTLRIEARDQHMAAQVKQALADDAEAAQPRRFFIGIAAKNLAHDRFET